jgi:hypothetical protein
MGTPLLARDAADMIQSAEFLWLVGALIAILLLGAVLISWIERWRKRQLSDNAAADIEQISNYRTMFERGELTIEEYERIKRKEAHRLRDKLIAKPDEPKPSAKAPPAQPLPQEPESPPPDAV